uniref:Small nuclear ribonucleoprotein E n=1 Tax=Rhizophora mucronata TaxID=61149 RepID=A0A2P2JL25_RHIMU
MLSPFRRILPRAFLVFFLTLTSSASSRTKFMYSSKPCYSNISMTHNRKSLTMMYKNSAHKNNKGGHFHPPIL